ncbi:hypothetical protein Patl1_32261 [Pistacia atlantica]|uniref:Uncharacterized protein n=1 Tax=Pistacia atlantica TaxID=434234 RepID=A0ACC1AN39_9ROSI|nr:hypothetical protein Patl1_32261 [Pistacia atlantica]
MEYVASVFYLSAMLKVSKVMESVSLETQYFVVSDMPDKLMEPTYGVIVNSFEELESAYVKEYSKVKDNKVWCIRPVSLYSKDYLDKVQPGNKADIDDAQCLKWLNSQDTNSVIYIYLGSLYNIVPA